MRFSSLTFALGLLGILSLSGCISSPPVVYQLQPSIKPSSISATKAVRDTAVLLGPIGLPDYLKQDVLMQRQVDGNLQPEKKARWAGSVQDNVDRVLLHALAEQLNSNRLVFYSEREGFKYDLQAVIRIDRLDSGPDQPVILEAQWRLMDAQGEQRTSRILRLQESHGPSVADQVRVQGVLLQQLSEQLARDIQWAALESEADAKARASASAAKSKNAPKKREREDDKDRGKPAAGAKPLRTDMDVFRF